MRKESAESKKKEKVTLGDVFLGIKTTQSYVLGMDKNLNEKIDSMKKDFTTHFNTVDDRLQKVEEKLVEHDKRFDSVDEQLQGIRNVTEGHNKRIVTLEEAMK